METSKPDTTPTPDDLAVDRLYAAWKDDRNAAAPLTLREWTARYPAHKADFTEWSASLPVLQCEEDLRGPEIDRAEARAQESGRRAIAARRARYTVAAPALTDINFTAIHFTDIYAAAKERGLNPRTLAVALGVGLPLVAKLQQRLIRTSTIPAAFIERLAHELQVTAQQVSDYLRQPPSLAAGASYKSNGVPQAAPQEDFARAIRSCPDLSEEQKAVWLAQIDSD